MRLQNHLKVNVGVILHYKKCRQISFKNACFCPKKEWNYCESVGQALILSNMNVKVVIGQLINDHDIQYNENLLKQFVSICKVNRDSS